MLCLAFCGFLHAQLKPPSLISFNPTQAGAGTTVTITFSGMNFVPRAMNLVFSPAQGITVSRLQVLSPNQISAQVQIDASAQPGSRQVILIDADHSLRSPTPFTITAAQNCPPGMAATAACGSAQPALRGFSPLQGTQGTSVTLTFTGANFSAPASVQFMPSNGLTVQSTTVTNPNEIRAQVSIAPTAPLGARGVVLVVGEKTRLPASNTFTVVSGVSRGLPMQILRVVPNQIAAGSQNVDLTLEGSNFVPGTQVTFTVGAGVPAAVFANGPARYVNSTEIHVTVNALPSALPGGRDLNLQTPNQQAVVGKGMLNVMAAAKPSGPPTLLKIPPITLQNFPLGVIKLDAPLQVASQSDQYVTYTVPLLDDSSVFKWHEQNPGLADYYELRVYAKDGKTLLATQKITGTREIAVGGWLNVVPTYYRPDDAFLKEVLEPVRRLIFSNLSGGLLNQPTPSAKTPVLSIAHSQSLGNSSPQPASGGNSNPTFPPDQLNGQLSQGDLQWEVAGFHTYNKSGVSTQQDSKANVAKGVQSVGPGQVQNPSQNSANSQPSSGTVDLEVEISDRWPLRAPLAPTGMACAGTGMGNGSLQVQNLTKKAADPSSTDPNNYVGDQWALGGNIDLSRSPYQPKFTPQTVDPPNCGQQCLVKYVSQVQFDNVFVDWGDGTVQALTAPPATSNLYNWDPSQPLTLPQDATSPMQHAYQSTGGYTVRVFQLSEADLQHVSAASVSASVDGPTTPFMQTALLSKLASQGTAKGGGFTLASVQSGFQQIVSQGNSAAAQVASAAYMLYCHTVYITVIEDLAADGPLHLMGIADPDFGAYDIEPVMPGSGLLNRVSLGNQAAKVDEVASGAKATSQPAAKQPKEHAKLGSFPLSPSSPAPVAICSTCDDGMDASTYLKYYGSGQVLVTWIVDGAVSQQMPMAIGPSTRRMNLTRQGFTTIQFLGTVIQIPIPEPPIIISNSASIYSPALPVQPVGNHNVMVEADVMPQPTMPNLSIAVGRALGSLMPIGLSPPAGASGSGNKQIAGPNVAEAQSLLNTLSAPAGSNLPPLKVGILSPSNHSSAGLGAVQYVNGPLQLAVSQLTNTVPDQHVASNTVVYEAVASDHKKPCKFLFPVKSGGAFEISGLQNHVTQQGTTYKGTGNLIIHLANANSLSYVEYPPIPVPIDNWIVPDGLHVQTGTINVSPNLALDASVPALQGSIVALSGQAGGELDATLNVTLSDDTLRLPGEKPVSWNGVTAELHPNGDWMKDGLTLPSTLIGWSAFIMQSSAVRLDLSHHDGDAAAWPCNSLQGTDWVGVRFSSLAITPYTMDLVSSSALQPVVTGWGVIGSGLCGTLSTGPFTASLGAGSVSFASINATAFDRGFNALYKGMDVYVPWLDTHLKGDATLQSGGGKQASFSFPLSSPPVSKTYGNFGFTASNLQFTPQQNVGWVVQANTHFVFSADNKQFAAFDRTFYFGMNGRGYFAQGTQSQDVPLGGSSSLRQTPVDLVSVHLTAAPSGDQVLAALFNTSVHLSEVMAAAVVQVNYEIDKSGTNYSTTGPTNSPFTIDVPYPSGQPSSEATVHPVYSGGSNSEYSGSVDLSELGGPSMKGEFRLGYQNGHDYWLTRVGVTLPSGVPVAPGLSLFKVQGGIGHNFPIGAFEDVGSLNAESPDTSQNSFLFMAGARIGTSDEFTCTVDGDLVIKASGQDAGARMDFHSWILKPPDNGNGDFKGYFQYAGGNFDGRIWGRLSFVNDAAYADLGSNKNNAAIDLHFGPSGPWHVDFGKQLGPRVRGHLLVTDADMYMMLSPTGLSLGGGESIDLEAGAGGISGYIKGGVDMGLTVTPQPHIAGDFSGYLEAGACVSISIPLDGSISGCVNVGVTAQVHAEFAPLDVHASATVGTPVGDVTVSVHL
jgi:hypothetical protein